MVRICKEVYMEKIFKLGLVLGRFNHIHNGHKQIINASRKVCEKTLILVGSAQESGTLRNPFKLETRQKAIARIYNTDDVIIGALKDYTNEKDISPAWGRYILENVNKDYGKLPDLMIYGKDESRKGWFSDEDSKKFSELIISRDKIKISATELRKYMVDNREEKWREFVPEEIWDMYDELREELMMVECYKNMR